MPDSRHKSVPRCWFFDLDGTLADTEADIRASWRETIADFGLDPERFDRLFVVGPSIDEIIRLIYPERYAPELVEDIRRGFAAHYDAGGFPRTREYPGVLDGIRRLKVAGCKAYVVTNKRYAATRIMAAHFGWDRVFDGLYAGDMHKDDPIGKLRKPQLLAQILRELSEDVSDCVMVGDTVNDFEAARANGVRSVGVTWGYGTPDELRQADVTVDLKDIGSFDPYKASFLCCSAISRTFAVDIPTSKSV